MLKVNLLAIIIFIPGLIFAGNAFGQKNPAGDNVRVRKNTATAALDTGGVILGDDVNAAGKRTSTRQAVKKPNGLIDTSSGEIVWANDPRKVIKSNNQSRVTGGKTPQIEKRKSLKPQPKAFTASDEEMKALIAW